MAAWRRCVGGGLLVVAVAGGCDARDVPPSRGASREGEPSARPVVPPPAVAPRGTTQGELAGVRYLEHMTGGARPEERVPMIVALHPMDADPADLLPMLRGYRRRARLILPYGHPRGDQYFWYDSVRGDDVAATRVTREADRVATALAALVSARPTVGKPLVTGFSQGGMMTFALAITHPEALAAAFPISGLLPLSLYPSAALSSEPRPPELPPVVAFHGASDLAVPTRGARDSIAELQSVGYSAELHEYPGVEHDISGEELAEILMRIGQAADSLVVAAPAR
ncbi:MAG TPA: dienelactone hydrolase family protein [Polyangiaceae bacterium]|nr:dienelactone hydrolase family protein [Polyangiaceae bacterium]